jgi:hypothetical protein
MQPELLGIFSRNRSFWEISKESNLLGNLQGIDAFRKFARNRSFWGNFQVIGAFGKFSSNRSFWEIVKKSELLENFQGIGAFGEFSTFRVQFPISQFSLWGLRHPNSIKIDRVVLGDFFVVASCEPIELLDVAQAPSFAIRLQDFA